MSYLKKGARFNFNHDYLGDTVHVAVEVLEECKPCALESVGRPYITGPGPYLRVTPIINGRPLSKTHPLNDPFKGLPQLLACAQDIYHTTRPAS